MLLKEINVRSKTHRSDNVNFMSATAAATQTVKSLTGAIPPPVPQTLKLIKAAVNQLPKQLTGLLERNKRIFQGLTFEEQDGVFISQPVSGWRAEIAIADYNSTFDNALIEALKKAPANADGVKDVLVNALTLRTESFPFIIDKFENRVTLTRPTNNGFFFKDIEDPKYALGKINPGFSSFIETNGLCGLDEISLPNGNVYRVWAEISDVDLDVVKDGSNPFDKLSARTFNGIGYRIKD